MWWQIRRFAQHTELCFAIWTLLVFCMGKRVVVNVHAFSKWSEWRLGEAAALVQHNTVRGSGKCGITVGFALPCMNGELVLRNRVRLVCVVIYPM